MADPMSLKDQKAYLDATGGTISGGAPVDKTLTPLVDAHLKEANRLGLSQPTQTDKQRAQLEALMKQRAAAQQLQQR